MPSKRANLAFLQITTAFLPLFLIKHRELSCKQEVIVSRFLRDTAELSNARDCERKTTSGIARFGIDFATPLFNNCSVDC